MLCLDMNYSLVLTASCWQCCTSGPNTVRTVAMSGASSETSSCSRSGRNMWSVRNGYSADWKKGVWLGCHAHCGNLARVQMIWVMVTDSRYRTDAATDCWLTTGSAISMGVARSVMTTWLARTGTTTGTR